MRQLFLLFAIGLFSASVLFAQDAGSVDKQIKGLKGEVKKITSPRIVARSVLKGRMPKKLLTA
jgi:hypothetical protein